MANNTSLESGIVVSTEKPTRVRYHLAFLLLIIAIFAYLDRINVSILIADKNFLSDLGIANNALAKGSLMSVFLICYGIGNVVMGGIADWLGPKKTFLISIFSWSVACAIGGLAGTFAATLIVFLVGRAVLGFGQSLQYPVQNVLIRNWFPNNERGKANSFYLIGMNIAPVIGMPLFTAMVIAIGWQNVLYSQAIAGMIPFLLVWFLVSDHPRGHKYINKAERDYIESALEKEEHENNAKTGTKTTYKENMKILVTDYRFWVLVVYYCCATSIFWGVVAWLPSYLKDARGFSWAAMGILSSLPFVVKVLVTMFIGHISDKMGRRAPFMAVSLYGAALFILLAALVPNNWASAGLITIAVGFLSVGTPAMWALVQQMLPSKAVGAGAGLLNGISNAFSALAPVAIGIMITLTGSYTGGLMYLVGCGVVAGSSALFLSFKKL